MDELKTKYTISELCPFCNLKGETAYIAYMGHSIPTIVSVEITAVTYNFDSQEIKFKYVNHHHQALDGGVLNKDVFLTVQDARLFLLKQLEAEVESTSKVFNRKQEALANLKAALEGKPCKEYIK